MRLCEVHVVLYFLTSIMAVLGHGQQEPARVPVRFGMTMTQVYDAFGEPFEFPGRLRSDHARFMVDWLGGAEFWSVWYDNYVVAPDLEFRAVRWKREYQPLYSPPAWLCPTVAAIESRFDLQRYFPPVSHEAKPGWFMHPWSH